MTRLTVFSKMVNLIYAIYLALLMVIAPNPAYVTSAKTEHAALEIQNDRLVIWINSVFSEYDYWKYNVISGNPDMLSLQEMKFEPDDPTAPQGNGKVVYTMKIERYGVIAILFYADLVTNRNGIHQENRTLSCIVSSTVTGKAYLSEVVEDTALYP